jgi:murein DD-endopeptidase MepM/ murein hydrolase activator NlpD
LAAVNIKYLKNAAPALLLCAAMLLGGPVTRAYANYGDEGGYIDDYSGDEEEYYEEGPAAQAAGGLNEVERKYQGRIAEINNRINEIKAENERLNASISNAKTEKERAQAEKNALDYQIDLTREQIDAYLERIDLLYRNIEAKEKSIDLKEQAVRDKQAEIDHSYDILKKRLRAKYMQSSVTTLGLVLGAESFSDLLTRIEYTRRIADHDKAVLAELAEQRAGLEEEQRGLEADKRSLEIIQADVEADRLESENQKEILGVQVQKAQLQVQDMAEMERQFLADLQKNKQASLAMQAELDRIFREIEWSKNAYAGGAMAWPVPAYVPGGRLSVTSEYGWRFNHSDFHTGIDFSGTGIHGSSVVAANSGKVVTANTAYTPGWSYGKYVLIDHGVDENGNSIATLYAHLYDLNVSVGQEVKRGEAIGQVGSTGWSTGPHLHFEVRVNQKAVNPRPYVFG